MLINDNLRKNEEPVHYVENYVMSEYLFNFIFTMPSMFISNTITYRIKKIIKK